MAGRGKQHGRRVIWAVLVVTISAFVLGAARLAFGPVSLNFARTAVGEALSEPLTDYDVNFSDLLLVWNGWFGGLDLEARNVVMRNERGLEVLQIPRLEIGFDLWPLISGDVRIRRLGVRGPKIKLVRREDGMIGFASVAHDKAGTAAAAIRAMLTRPDAAQEIGSIQRVDLEDLTLVLENLPTSEIWRAEGGTLSLRPETAGLELEFSIALDTPGGATALRGDGHWSAERNIVSLSVAFARLIPSTFATDFGSFKFANGIHVPLVGSADLIIRLDPIQPVEVAFSVTAEPGTIARPEIWENPIALTSAKLVGNWSDSRQAIEFERLQLDLNGAILSGYGTLGLTSMGPTLEASLKMRNWPLERMWAIWPMELKEFSRNWLKRNLQGKLSDGTLSLHLDSAALTRGVLANDSFTMAFTVQDLEGFYLRPMPPVYGASGRVHFTPEQLSLTLEGGAIAAPLGHGEIAVPNLDVVLKNLNLDIEDIAEVTATAHGPAAALADILDSEPLGYTSLYGLSPARVTGQADLKLWFALPLLKELYFEQIDFDIAAQLTALGVDLDWHSNIEQGELHAQVNPQGLDAKGQIVLGKTVLEAAWNERFDDTQTLPTRFTVSGRIDPEMVQRFMVPGIIEGDGSIVAELTVRGHGINIAQGEANLDLEPLNIAVPVLDWRKERGAPGTLQMQLSAPGEETLIESFSLASAGLVARGSARLNGDVFRDANIDALKVGRVDLTGRFERLDHNEFALRIAGQSLDAVPVLDRLREVVDLPEPISVEADFDIGRVYLHNDVVVRNVKGSVRQIAGWLEEAHLIAQEPQGVGLFLSAFRDGVKRRLRLYAEDAGALLRGLDIYTGSANGSLAVEANVEDNRVGSPVVGNARIQNVDILNAPGLARVLSLASLTGIGDILSGGSLHFDHFGADFEMIDHKIHIRDASGVGSQIGLNLQGVVDNRANLVNLTGVVIPAYALNSLIRKIPIVGDILSAGQGEGILAVGFRIKGSADDPEAEVDPLMALAPGILRQFVVVDSVVPRSLRPKDDSGVSGLFVPLD